MKNMYIISGALLVLALTAVNLLLPHTVFLLTLGVLTRFLFRLSTGDLLIIETLNMASEYHGMYHRWDDVGFGKITGLGADNN